MAVAMEELKVQDMTRIDDFSSAIRDPGKDSKRSSQSYTSTERPLPSATNMASIIRLRKVGKSLTFLTLNLSSSSLLLA
jgi:hypothetical protein